MLYGPAGTGKSHICAACCDLWPEEIRYPRYWQEREFHEKVRESFGYTKGDYTQTIRDMVDHDLVIIDDIGSTKNSEFKEEVLTAAIDYLFENCTPAILTTNMSPDEIESLYHPRVYSRIFAKKNTVICLTDLPDRRLNGIEGE